MLSFFSNIFGSKNDRILRRMNSLVNQANDLEKMLSEKPDSYFIELKDQLSKKYHENDKDMYSLLPHAFAAVREASKRTLGYVILIHKCLVQFLLQKEILLK